MNKYIEYKNYCEEKVNNFPMMFAFSKGQFEEGLVKLGTTKEGVTSIGGGGFIRKKDKEDFEVLMVCLDTKLEESIKEDNEFVLQMFEYEMENHEYYLSRDDEEILSVCGLGVESINDERLRKLYKEAKKNHLLEYSFF